MLLLLALVALVPLAGLWYANDVFGRVERVELAGVLSTAGPGKNYLVVGSDARDPARLAEAGLNPEAFADGGGQRSDTIMLLRIDGAESRMMSIPRDLFVEIAGTGERRKINAALAGGQAQLVQTVQQSLGLPVHRYVEVDFVSFANVVDALGGVTIDFPHPAFDRNSGLQVETAGPVRLDGAQALAYVRSRYYVEVVNGRNVPDPTADLGRMKRQQQFLRAVFAELGGTRNPIELARAAGGAAGGVRIDDAMSLGDALRLGWRLRTLDPEPVELPVEPGSNAAGSVLLVRQPDATAALDLMR